MCTKTSTIYCSSVILFFLNFRWYHKWISSAFQSCAKHLIWSFPRCHLNFPILQLVNWNGKFNCDRNNRLFSIPFQAPLFPWLSSTLFNFLWCLFCCCCCCVVSLFWMWHEMWTQIFTVFEESTLHIHSLVVIVVLLPFLCRLRPHSRSQCGNMLCHSIAIYIQYSCLSTVFCWASSLWLSCICIHTTIARHLKVFRILCRLLLRCRFVWLLIKFSLFLGLATKNASTATMTRQSLFISNFVDVKKRTQPTSIQKSSRCVFHRFWLSMCDCALCYSKNRFTSTRFMRPKTETLFYKVTKYEDRQKKRGGEKIKLHWKAINSHWPFSFSSLAAETK